MTTGTPADRTPSDRGEADAPALTYPFPTGTVLGDAVPAGYRRDGRSGVVGRGEADLERLGALVLDWQVRRRSGLRVLRSTGPRLDAEPVREGLVTRLSVPVLSVRSHRVASAELRLLAPTRVVRVLREADRIGFAYGTLPGHPVRGEESFIVRLRRDGAVLLELRTLSRIAFPFALAVPVARRFQERAAAAYLRALLP